MVYLIHVYSLIQIENGINDRARKGDRYVLTAQALLYAIVNILKDVDPNSVVDGLRAWGVAKESCNNGME